MSRAREKLSRWGFTLRLSAFALSQWKLIALLAFIASPVGPHVRFSFSYTLVSGERIYQECSYLGSRGVIWPNLEPECPLIAVLDSRRWRR